MAARRTIDGIAGLLERDAPGAFVLRYPGPRRFGPPGSNHPHVTRRWGCRIDARAQHQMDARPPLVSRKVQWSDATSIVPRRRVTVGPARRPGYYRRPYNVPFGAGGGPVDPGAGGGPAGGCDGC